MKNTIAVLIVLLLSSPVFAQDNVVYPKLDSYLQAEKNVHGLLRQVNNKQWNYKHFIELFNSLLHPVKRSTGRPVTFMDGPVIYSMALRPEISRDANTLYQRYPESLEQSSVPLQVLGLVGGITAAAFTSKKYHYTGLNNESPLNAYLQSTYHQEHRQ